MQKPHSHRLRSGRVSEPNRIYLLTTVSNNRERLFSDIYLGRIVVRSMRHHHEAGYVSSMAYVVMPDHLHWLISLAPEVTLSRLMQSFKSYTAREINYRRKTSGKRIWQSGFHDHALRQDEDILMRRAILSPIL